MKPITVILPGGGTWSMSADEGRTLAEQILRACDAVAPETIDPTPLPPPALGMRVWFEHTHPSGDTVTYSKDMRDASPGERWGENVNEIVIITDFRTSEVIWRRS